MSRTVTVPADSVQVGDDGNATVTFAPDAKIVLEDELDGWVPKSTFDKATEGIESRISTAIENARKGFRTDVVQDDDFLRQVAKSRRQFFEELFPGGDGPDPEVLLQRFRESEVEPLNAELAAEKERGEKLRRSSVQGANSEALSKAGVAPKSRDLFRDHLALRTRYSDEHDTVVVIDQSTGKVVEKLDGGAMVPESPLDYLNRLRSTGEWDDHFEASVREGADADIGDGAGDRLDLDAQIAKAESDGRTADAMALKEKKLQRGQAPK